jgi:hypothetical protein
MFYQRSRLSFNNGQGQDDLVIKYNLFIGFDMDSLN